MNVFFLPFLLMYCISAYCEVYSFHWGSLHSLMRIEILLFVQPKYDTIEGCFYLEVSRHIS